MEPDIKRINFFDGLFLRQGEFQAEQLYHLHMRRRLNYILFDRSGVVQVETGDLRITATAPAANKTFRVTAGMAISRRDDLREGREIILRQDSANFDLDDNFGAGDEVFVAIRYAESLAEPQTIAAPNTQTRVEETAEITLHDVWPPAANPESYILLGTITYDTMAVDETQRQTSLLRASLIGGAIVSPGAPSITSMNPNSAAPSSTVPVQIAGANLTGASVTCSDPNVTVSGVTATSTTLDFTLTIGAAATTFTVTITTATPPAASATFTITAVVPAPILLTGIPNTPGTQLAPPIGNPGTGFEIFGQNLRIDFPTLPAVVLVNPATNAVIHTFNVTNVRLETQPGFGPYNVIDAGVGAAVPGIQTGRVRVTTSGGSVVSTENFTIVAP
jgi:hypothetical protein